MSETQGFEIRNYLTAGGFLLIGILFLVSTLSTLELGNGTAELVATDMIKNLVFGLLFFAVGTILVILRGRDIAAITFILTGLTDIAVFFCGENANASWIFAIVNILWAIIILFAQDKEKYLFFVLNLLLGITTITKYLPDAPVIVKFIPLVLLILIALYYAFAAGCERISLPGRKLLTADTVTEFKKSGSSIGYVLFALSSGLWVLIYLFGIDLSAASIFCLERALGIALIVIGILLAYKKLQFTPVMFILMGVGDLIASFSSGIMIYAVGILLVVAGIFALMRKESRILVGVMLILYGCSAFLSAITGTSGMSAISLVLNGIPCLIALYLAVATLSQRKMPLI